MGNERTAIRRNLIAMPTKMYRRMIGMVVGIGDADRLLPTL